MSIATVPADVALARRAPARTRPWYLDVWVQMVRRKPLGTMGGAIGGFIGGDETVIDYIKHRARTLIFSAAPPPASVAAAAIRPP